MAVQLRNPVPNAVSAGEVCQAVSVGGQHGFTEWRDGSDNIHLVASFNGEASNYSTKSYVVHHVNMTAGVSHLTTGLKGYLGKQLYDPATDRFYMGGSYSGSFGYLNPTTGAITSIKNDFQYSLIGGLLKGDDGKIYFIEQPFKLYSYNDADGLMEYGDFSPSASETNYNSLWVDATHIYFGIVKQETYEGAIWFDLKIGLIGAAKEDFVSYDFTAEHDFRVAFQRDYNTKELLLRRTLVDQVTYKYYSLAAGVLIEVTKALNPEYAWNEAGTSITGNYGVTIFDYTPFCYATSSPPATGVLNWEVDASKMAPLPSSQEYSKIGYREGGEGDWSYSQKDYTGPWQSFDVGHLVHNTGRGVYIPTDDDYGPVASVSYASSIIAALGFSQVSPYGGLKLPSGMTLFSGYSGGTLLWNPAEAWTLHSGNSTPFDYGDPDAPNPYFLNIARSGIVHHYRFGMDYDADGKVWGGGNATRSLANPGAGNVYWYDPSDGSSGYVFDGTGGKPDWDDLEVYFRSLCPALSRTKMVVSGNNGYLYVVNCADATIDGSYNLGENAYMVEVANDAVLGVTPGGNVFLFKPSDQTMITAPASIGLAAYTPFGFVNSTYPRMKYKMEIGPDGYAWMFFGSRLYKIHPTTLAPMLVKSFDTYYMLKFLDTAGDQSVYDLMLYGNGKNLYYVPEMFYTPATANPDPGPEMPHLGSIGGGVNAASVAGARVGNVAGCVI